MKTRSTSSRWQTVLVLVLLAFAAIMAIASSQEYEGSAGEEAEVEAPSSSEAIIGIDLGTTYSCVGVVKNGRVEIIANDQGNRITPSYVAWGSGGERLIGDAAKNQATSNPENTVFDVKRLIGRKFGEKTVQADSKLFPFKIVDKDNTPNIQVNTTVNDTRRSVYKQAVFDAAA